jgi:hypothetical protein
MSSQELVQSLEVQVWPIDRFVPVPSESVYEDYDIATLENRLEEALEVSRLGELDGHETGPESTVLFL